VSTVTFPLVPRRRVIGLAFGGMRSARRGLGSDVAGSRPYRPGDDVDAIDWAASAKLSAAHGQDEFVVREDFADESPRVVVLCDRRPTVAVAPPPAGRLRKAAALEWALALISRSAVAARSLVGYLDLAEREPYWRPPRTEHQAPIDGERPFRAAESSVADGLAFLTRERRDLPPGSFVFVVSDFLAPPSREAWRRLHELRLDAVPVVIQDPVWERSFPAVGGVVIPFADPETGRTALVRLTDREAAARREQNEERWASLLHDLRSAGLDPVVLGSHDHGDVTAAFMRWADQRIYLRGHA
jgi:uncharacterized protein (DUF58 family)